MDDFSYRFEKIFFSKNKEDTYFRDHLETMIRYFFTDFRVFALVSK